MGQASTRLRNVHRVRMGRECTWLRRPPGEEECRACTRPWPRPGSEEGLGVRQVYAALLKVRRERAPTRLRRVAKWRGGGGHVRGSGAFEVARWV
jgi:hypothetical protein